MNILISHDRRAQIADFGLTIVGDVTVGRMSTRKPGSGTVRWMSPERLLSDEPKRLERSDDVYAFGGLIYMVSVSFSENKTKLNMESQMFSHKLPWDGLSDPAVYRRAGRKSLPGSRLDCNTPCGMSIPDEAWRLVQACWSDAGLPLRHQARVKCHPFVIDSPVINLRGVHHRARRRVPRHHHFQPWVSVHWENPTTMRESPVGIDRTLVSEDALPL
jgi:serine/threonine protein kinase